ncbi:MAG TPA: tRNA uridine-5-carboxymethylaminomethyl(34) synthesis GTPase MnmE [Steroidobacteraceae bacterium]|nr:tRNA uridine-5-carboxymethylaminomethyl(34) synthesis GTPase MnmE [Steroidobacteraceae bacterium]
MPTSVDTIVATASPPGRGGIGIVRVSGPDSARIATAILGALPPARYATRARFLGADGTALDEGLALYFPAPHSYTGEAVLELHGHGGPLLTEALIARALALGARRAQPGEFTQRAYLNDKLDLAQAEAVADLIDAGSEAAARAALRSLQGEFSLRVRSLDEALAQLRAHVEATIDFPTDEIDYLAEPTLALRLAAVRAQCAALQETAQQGRLLTEGLTVVIAGAPNAGKSTLLNRLTGHEAAIVSEIPGTTRDLLRERVQIEGVPVLLLDTAGLRESGDSIETEGVRRARVAMAQADHVLFLVDAVLDPEAAGFVAERERLPANVSVTLVRNKTDLLPQGAPVAPAIAGVSQLRLSALEGTGLEELRLHLLEAAGYQRENSGTLSARRRHLEALAATAAHLAAAERCCSEALAAELVAEELRSAQRSLGEITGAGTADELLGRIFAAFCIGK